MLNEEHSSISSTLAHTAAVPNPLPTPWLRFLVRVVSRSAGPGLGDGRCSSRCGGGPLGRELVSEVERGLEFIPGNEDTQAEQGRPLVQ